MIARPILAIDVGNSSTNIGLFTDANTALSKTSPFRTWAFPTNRLPDGSIVRQWKTLHRRFPGLRDVVVSSVVPAADDVLRRKIAAAFRVRPLFVTSKTKSRVRIRYGVPREVGADRIVNARGAIALWPRRPAIIVDFGTATTFDCVTARGDYLGGVIAPGPAISAEALYRRTAKLPFVRLETPSRVLGRNTRECMQSGLYHGYRGLVREIVGKLRKKMGSRVVVVATGGQARWVLKGVSVVRHFVPDLTLIGLLGVWQDVRGCQSTDCN